MITVDITCDLMDEDETGYVWTFLHEARDPGRQDGAMTGLARGDADDEARGRNDAIIGAQNGGPKPANAASGSPLRSNA